MPELSSRSRRYIWGAAAVLVVTALGAMFWPRSNGPDYVTETLATGDIENLVTATGSLQPREYVDVGAQVSGQLKKILVEVGSQVKAGDLVAEIDTTVYTAKVEASRASLRNQQAQLIDRRAQLTLAQMQLKRQEQMQKDDATSLEEVQVAKANAQSAEAQLKSLEAQIAQIQSSLKVEEANLAYAKIYAPMDGTVVSITARQGQTLNTNQTAPTLLRVADLSTMTVRTQVSEADVGKLRVGMPVYFTTLGGQGRRWYSTLARLEPTPEVVNNVVLYNALFDVPNAEGSLLPQMSTQVFFVQAQAKNVVLVPVSALEWESSAGKKPSDGTGKRKQKNAEPAAAVAETEQTETSNSAPQTESTDGTKGAQPERRRGRKAQVKVLVDGKIELRPVRVGVSNRVHAEVLEGLSAGDQVVSGTKIATAKPATTSPLGGMGGGGMGGMRR
jgi:membrane fusion protein, macrolide-specific efflux system